MIELRSDTYTLPTPEMLDAMVTAPLGNDVYGEDPTARLLEETAAEILGKEAACLTPSGTMANLAAVMAQAARGEKLLVGNRSDLYLYEAGGVSVCGGVVFEPIATQPDGRLLLSDLEDGLPADPGNPEFAPAALVCLENPHNQCGGRVLPLDHLREVREFADRSGLRVHLDGARIFNAALALGVPAADVAACADTVQVCLSKGLSAPIGSVVAGSAETVARIRTLRKMLGGGMRQAGIVAAAGLYSLRHLTDRLADDHANARRLAEGLAGIDGIEADPESVDTNMVVFRVAPGRLGHPEFLALARKEGLALAELGRGQIRAVTHRGVDGADVERALSIIARVVKV